MARYLIPKPITRQYELFPGSGWGLGEAAVAVMGVVLGALLFAGLTLIGVPVVVRLITGIGSAGLGIGLAFPPPLGEPAYRVIQRWWAYQHQPHRYLYDWTASDWPEDLTMSR